MSAVTTDQQWFTLRVTLDSLHKEVSVSGPTEESARTLAEETAYSICLSGLKLTDTDGTVLFFPPHRVQLVEVIPVG